MLWWVTHGKQQTVDGLEIWYLGANKIKKLESPSIIELQEIENELNLMWSKLKSVKVSIEDFPPNPSPLRGFLEGGVPTNPPDAARCDNCEWRKICQGGLGNDNFPENKSFNIPGNLTAIETTEIENLNPRLTIICEVFSVFESKNKRPALTVYQGQKMAKIDILVDKNQDGVTPWPEKIAKGDRIIQNLLAILITMYLDLSVKRIAKFLNSLIYSNLEPDGTLLGNWCISLIKEV